VSTGATPDDRPPVRGDLCLVTGASGFIGGHVARRLRAEGYLVRCLVRPTSDTSALKTLGVELVTGDLTSQLTLDGVADSCRFVVHCGALVSDWATTAEIRAVNVAGTRRLLDASLAASVERFVHVSSTDVYGYPGTPQVDESHAPGRFSNWYSETKREAEAEVRRAAQTRAMAAVILRPATVYGPGSKDVVGEMARAIRGGHMLLVDRGRSLAGLVYVQNLVDAVLLALRHEAAPGEAFNVTDGLDVTWRRFLGDLAEGLGYRPPRLSVPYPAAYGVAFLLEHAYRLLRRTTGLRTAPLLSRQAVHVLGRNQDFSNRKARRLLGWEPRVTYPQGLEATLAWLREEHLAASHAAGP
jgi:nucleoside-diphosphate-sugar epimerase